jgi:hypothetical protein
VIHLTGKGGGSLISKAEFTSFELEWDWKLDKGGNNGIKYWVTKIGGKEWLGIEYQMIDDNAHPDAKRGDSHSTACIYDIKAAAKDKPLKPIGEWNTSKIVVNNGKIQHWLNGALVSRGRYDKRTIGRQRIAASKFKSKGRLRPRPWQDHADRTRRRDLVPQHPDQSALIPRLFGDFGRSERWPQIPQTMGLQFLAYGAS